MTRRKKKSQKTIILSLLRRLGISTHVNQSSNSMRPPRSTSQSTSTFACSIVKVKTCINLLRIERNQIDSKIMTFSSKSSMVFIPSMVWRSSIETWNRRMCLWLVMITKWGLVTLDWLSSILKTWYALVANRIARRALQVRLDICHQSWMTRQRKLRWADVSLRTWHLSLLSHRRNGIFTHWESSYLTWFVTQRLKWSKCVLMIVSSVTHLNCQKRTSLMASSKEN